MNFWRPDVERCDWTPPGGWDPRWNAENRWAVSAMVDAGVQAGYNIPDAARLATMCMNMRVLEGLRYSDYWMSRVGAFRRAVLVHC